MKKILVLNPVTLPLTPPCMLAGVAVGLRVSEPLAPVFFVTAVIVSMSLKMANLWQQFVLLTLGKLRSGTGRACSPSVETPAAPETA